MSPKIKNIIIFASIAVVFVLIYIFFVAGSEPEPDTNLISSGGMIGSSISMEAQPEIAQGPFNLLLSVKSIKLDDAIFETGAFANLHDSSIVLIPDGNEGRPNPFAPLGTDNVEMPQ